MLLPGSAHHLGSFHFFQCYLMTIVHHVSRLPGVHSTHSALLASGGKHCETLERFQRHIFFKIRCVYFLMWENKSSYPLNISVEEFDLSCFFFCSRRCFSICNHFSHRRNVITAHLEKKQIVELSLYALKHKPFSVGKFDCN